MDRDRSTFTTFADGSPDEITHLRVLPDTVQQWDIFRLAVDPTHVFVTEALRESLEAAALTGIRFMNGTNLMDMTWARRAAQEPPWFD